MFRRLCIACLLSAICGSSSAQADPSIRAKRLEAEQLAIGYNTYVGDLQDDVGKYRFEHLFAEGATHEFDFPHFGDQNVNLPVDEYVKTFSALDASLTDLRLIEFIPGDQLTLRAEKTSKYSRTTPCEGHDAAAFAEFEVEFSFVSTAEGLKIAHVEAIGNPSTGGSIRAIQRRRPHKRGELLNYNGYVRLGRHGRWMKMNQFIEETGGLPSSDLEAESGIQHCLPEVRGGAESNWAEFLRQWQDCEEQKGGEWTFFTWRDELQANGTLQTVAGEGWSSELSPSSFESDGGFSTGLKYSIWMPLKSNSWNWGIHGGVNFVTLRGSSSWDEIHWQQEAIDPDGMSYRRMTTASGLKERLTLNSLLIDAGFGVERRLGHRGPLMFSELGIGVFNPTSIKSNSESTIYVAGYYRNLFGVTIDHPEVYDFGFHSGAGSQDIQGRAAVYAKGLLGMRYIIPTEGSFDPTLTVGLGLLQTLSPWFDSTDSTWILGTTDIISPLSTNASSVIRSRYWHLGLGVPLWHPDCTD